MRYDVVFTTLPVLAMEDPDSTMLTEKGPIVRGALSLWSPVDTETDTYSVKHSLVRWKIRGQTTAELDKKCYKLTLEKNGGGKRNQNLLGLGKDDDWILNAMALDDFKVKEQFAMKLWNRLAEQSPWDYPMSSGAELTRLHNDTNCMAIGAGVTGENLALAIVDKWLETPFSGEARHQRRIDKVMALENE